MKRRYGRAHRLVRKKYASIVAAGNATCARCDEPILPASCGISTTTTTIRCSAAISGLRIAAATERWSRT